MSSEPRPFFLSTRRVFRLVLSPKKIPIGTCTKNIISKIEKTIFCVCKSRMFSSQKAKASLKYRLTITKMELPKKENGNSISGQSESSCTSAYSVGLRTNPSRWTNS